MVSEAQPVTPSRTMKDAVVAPFRLKRLLVEISGTCTALAGVTPTSTYTGLFTLPLVLRVMNGLLEQFTTTSASSSGFGQGLTMIRWITSRAALPHASDTLHLLIMMYPLHRSFTYGSMVYLTFL